MLVCSSPAKPSHGSRRSLKRTSVDGSVQTHSNRNLTSVADQAEHHRRLRNSVIKSNRRSPCGNDITEAAEKKPCVPSIFSSRQSTISDDKLIDSSEFAAKLPAQQRRKRGWPKGMPRKKRVIRLCGQ